MIDSMILKSKAHQNPSTLKPVITPEINIIIRAFITKVKSPMVITLIGNVKNRRIGRTKVFITANRIATSNAGKNPATVTPGKMYAVIITAKAVISRLTIIHVVIIKIKLKNRSYIIRISRIYSNKNQRHTI